jgi:lysosomal acid lipase/cholesteryl ester hydrolase
MGDYLGKAWRWSQLLVALVMVVIEWMLREAVSVVLRVVPVPWSSSYGNDPKHRGTDDPNWERGTIEYVEAKGYRAEEHFVTTPDGYILGLHRVPATITTTAATSDNGADEAAASVPTTPRIPRPVLIIHGFMQSSEAFAVRHNASDSLPLVLSDAGYDVWLGNNRGNKYSHKHVHKKPIHEDFWDYSLDDLARYDLPSMIDYVLAHTGAKTLTLIGFSQGTAQSFAFLSNPAVSWKVNLFVALAPVSVPRGFANPIADSIARARPDFIFLLFGKRQLLPSTLFWRNFLPRAVFVKAIDFALKFLFGWTTECLAESEKPLLYSHLYSHTSVKTIVQWFQLIQTGKFQMFDDYMANASSSGTENYSGYSLPQYQLGHIRTPTACFCGGRDTLPQTPLLLASLPKDKKVFVHTEERYEHLDFMWAKDIAQTVYPKILKLMDKYSNAQKEEDSLEL